MKKITVILMLICGVFVIKSNVIAVPLSADKITPAKVGTKLPKLKLTTLSGKNFDLNAELKKQPIVLIFYRGGWCPYCNRHLNELQKIEPKLFKLGYKIIAISPDSPDNLRKTVNKQHLSYSLLSDHKMSAAKALGIAFEVDAKTIKRYKGYGINLEKASGEKHHQLPVPSVFIVGQDRVIKFVYTNVDYKIRLNPNKLIVTAKKIQQANK